jgi:glycosyltransferase involved in cell wall biosynthesis
MYLSTARWEGMPLALLEAMAAGIPILASNVTGNKDVINQYTGELYELGDVTSAVNKIKDMLESEPFDKDVIKDYFNKHYSDSKMALEVLKVYKQFD